MRKIIFATGNEEKMREIREILAFAASGSAFDEGSGNTGKYYRRWKDI